MKIDLKNWEKNKQRTLFFAWPMAISSLLGNFIIPVAYDKSPTLVLLTPFLVPLVFVPFAYIGVRRHREYAEREKRALQDKYDAQDTAMFGKPLRELEL